MDDKCTALIDICGTCNRTFCDVHYNHRALQKEITLIREKYYMACECGRNRCIHERGHFTRYKTEDGKRVEIEKETIRGSEILYVKRIEGLNRSISATGYLSREEELRLAKSIARREKAEAEANARAKAGSCLCACANSQGVGYQVHYPLQWVTPMFADLNPYNGGVAW